MLTTALAAKLRAEFPDNHTELLAGLSLVLDATNKLLLESGQKQAQCIARRDFASATQLMTISQAVAEAEAPLQKLREALDVSTTASSSVQEVAALYGTPVALSAEFESTFTKPLGFQLRDGPLYSARTWQDLLVGASSQLLARHPQLFESAVTDNLWLRGQVSTVSSALRKARPLNDHFYIETNTGSVGACTFFLRLLEAMSLPASTLTIYLR